MADLRDVPFLSSLDDRMIADLEERLVQREYSAGEVVFRVGDPGLGMLVVLEGELAVLGPSERLLARLGVGEVVGEIALLDGGPRSATVRATRRTRCGLLVRGDLLPLLRSKPALTLELTRLITARLRANQPVAEGAEPLAAARATDGGLDRPLRGVLAATMLGESIFAAGRRSLETYLRTVRRGGDTEEAARQALEDALVEGVRAPARVAEALLRDDLLDEEEPDADQEPGRGSRA